MATADDERIASVARQLRLAERLKLGQQQSSMSIQQTRINIPEKELRAFCERHHIRRLALFGSVLREDFSADSDIDVLVEFEPGCTPGYAFFSIEEELSRLLNRDVDLNTPGFLSPHTRDKVKSEAQVQLS